MHLFILIQQIISSVPLALTAPTYDALATLTSDSLDSGRSLWAFIHCAGILALCCGSVVVVLLTQFGAQGFRGLGERLSHGEDVSSSPRAESSAFSVRRLVNAIAGRSRPAEVPLPFAKTTTTTTTTTTA